MRFRSTGLGETELLRRISDLSPNGKGQLVFHIQTYDPVQWHVWAGLEYEDIPKTILAFLKPSVFFHVLRTLIRLKKNPKEPESLFDEAPRSQLRGI